MGVCLPINQLGSRLTHRITFHWSSSVESPYTQLKTIYDRNNDHPKTITLIPKKKTPSAPKKKKTQ